MKRESIRRSDEVPTPWKSAVQRAVREYPSASQNELLRDIYRRCPWFALKSELHDLVSEAPDAPAAPLAIYTVGYEGKSVDSFFNELLLSGVAAILDVRANPISRKYGFARKLMMAQPKRKHVKK